MYQRIKASLLNPKKIVEYLNDRIGITIIYVVVFSLLFAIPYLLVIKDVGTTIKSKISKELQQKEVIEYTITDGYLKSKVEEEITYVFDFEDSSLNYITLVIGDDLNKVDSDYLESSIILQYAHDGIYFCQKSIIETKSKLMDYTKDFVDLSLIKDGDLNSIRETLKYVDLFIEKNKTAIYAIAIPSILVYSAMEILFTTLMSSVLLLIFFGKHGIKFGQIYKLTLYCSLPTVLGLLLTILFSSLSFAGIFNHIGFFVTTCFAVIAVNELIKQNYLKKNEENDNESI